MAALSMIVFSGDYDRSMAAFTIANGAAGEGDKVSMFFTFWGLALLRAGNGPGPGGLQSLFKLMLPIGPDRLRLSRLNFLGLGPIMLRRLLGRKGGRDLSALIGMAIERGVNFVACRASMELLGLSREELLPAAHLRVGDVHEFLRAAKEADICLFI